MLRSEVPDPEFKSPRARILPVQQVKNRRQADGARVQTMGELILSRV